MKRRSTIQSASKIKHVNHKIVIVGDSHGRKSAVELKHCLDSTFETSSFVKPGAGMRVILGTMQADIKKLKRDDVVVIFVFVFISYSVYP